MGSKPLRIPSGALPQKPVTSDVPKFKVSIRFLFLGPMERGWVESGILGCLPSACLPSKDMGTQKWAFKERQCTDNDITVGFKKKKPKQKPFF